MTPDKADDSTRIVLVNEEDISQALDELIRDGLVECFPPDAQYFSRQSWWHTRPLWRVLAQDRSGAIIGHIAVVVRTVLVGAKAEPVEVAGIQSVFVRPDRRSEGISDRMIEQVISEANRRQLDAGLLFCVPEYESVYGRMGWTKIQAEVFMRNSEGKSEPIPGKNITMIHRLNGRAFPDGDIDLASPDW